MKRRLSEIDAPLFDLRRTLESGQVFQWLPEEEGQGSGDAAFRGVIGATPVTVKQEGARLRVTPGAEALVSRYFALDHPLEAIYATFPADPAMTEALAACRGVRIIRQPLWECLATFITSSMKQVRHIEQMSHALRRRFGEPAGEEGLFAYPAPERLAAASEEALRECGLGFRAPGLLGTARAVAEGKIDLEAIRALPDEAALAVLCRLPGVGPKIANCVLLFAYERVRAFPIDVWIERVLRHHYFADFPRKRAVTPRRLREFCASYFGPYGGYAQQYLFHHARRQPRSLWRAARQSPRPPRHAS